MITSLLAGLPIPRTIPGVPVEWIPEQGAIQAWELYTRCRNVSLGILGLMMLISCALHMCGMLGRVSGMNWYEPILKTLRAAVLIGALPTLIMPATIGLGLAVGNAIFSQDEIAALNQKFRDEAYKKEEARQATQSRYLTWFEKLGAVTWLVNPSQSFFSELILAAATILFYVAVALISKLWLILTATLFVVSPILIVMSVIPGIGDRILGAWIAAMVQLSFWLVLMAVFAFLVRTTDYLFQPALDIVQGKLTISNHYESIAIALVYALMYLAIPWIAQRLLPISGFAAGATSDFVGAGKAVVGAVGAVGSLATTTWSKLATAPATVSRKFNRVEKKNTPRKGGRRK